MTDRKILHYVYMHVKKINKICPKIHMNRFLKKNVNVLIKFMDLLKTSSWLCVSLCMCVCLSIHLSNILLCIFLSVCYIKISTQIYTIYECMLQCLIFIITCVYTCTLEMFVCAYICISLQGTVLWYWYTNIFHRIENRRVYI